MKATRRVCIVNELGMHLRAAGVLVQLAAKFEATIWLDLEGTRANAKSIMSVLALAAAKGVELDVIAEGADADAALDAVCKLIDAGFEGA